MTAREPMIELKLSVDCSKEQRECSGHVLKAGEIDEAGFDGLGIATPFWLNAVCNFSP
jgi:hypothetical protein